MKEKTNEITYLNNATNDVSLIVPKKSVQPLNKLLNNSNIACILADVCKELHLRIASKLTKGGKLWA